MEFEKGYRLEEFTVLEWAERGFIEVSEDARIEPHKADWYWYRLYCHDGETKRVRITNVGGLVTATTHGGKKVKIGNQVTVYVDKNENEIYEVPSWKLTKIDPWADDSENESSQN
jgi:hypothetical protein